MELNRLFKSIIDADLQPVVICDTKHDIVYMNPASIERYAKFGGAGLVGKSILDCHNEKSGEMIKKVVAWFADSKDNNCIHTFYNKNDNRDVYMIALRDDEGNLMGYYEKHESRKPETKALYDMK